MCYICLYYSSWLFYLIHNDSLGERYITSCGHAKFSHLHQDHRRRSRTASLSFLWWWTSSPIGSCSTASTQHDSFWWEQLSAILQVSLDCSQCPSPSAYRAHRKERAHDSQQGQPEFPCQHHFFQAQSCKKRSCGLLLTTFSPPKRAVLRMKLMSDSTGESVTEHPQNTIFQTWIQPRPAYGVLEAKKTLSDFGLGFCYFQLEVPWLVNCFCCCCCFCKLYNTVKKSWGWCVRTNMLG